ncbi:MAG: dihydroneopterin aldolase [Bacteroidota bacterium]
MKSASISLEDVRFYMPYGFYEEERKSGNEFRIDVTVETNIQKAADRDLLGQTVNYGTIYYLVKTEFKKVTQAAEARLESYRNAQGLGQDYDEPSFLLESAAYLMAKRIKGHFEEVKSVRLKLSKINPPVGGRVGAAAVEIVL